jgi:RNA-directed DNA polymerase
LRDDLKQGRFTPLPVKQRMIPKANGKLRSLGIPTAADRTVQASLKLVLEPIFEADFQPFSYGFRPRRSPHDAIAEIHMLASNEHTVVLEGDITACFDNIDHTALMGLVRERVADKRVISLVKGFLKAGVLAEDTVLRETKTGAPQGGILSPRWPTSHCRSWTTTSRRFGGGTWPRGRTGPEGAATVWRLTGWSATRMISWS